MARILDNPFGSGTFGGVDLFKKKEKKPDSFTTQEGVLRDLAGGIEQEEKARYEKGLGALENAYTSSNSILSNLVDPDLLFSKAADSVGARSRESLSALRSSLGARGINPNSGAANGMLSRLSFQHDQGITGAIRDTAIDNQRQRQVNAAVNFANALNLANYTQSPVSSARLETEQNVYEGMLTRKGIDAQAKSAKKASENNLLGSILGGVGSIIGGLF